MAEVVLGGAGPGDIGAAVATAVSAVLGDTPTSIVPLHGDESIPGAACSADVHAAAQEDIDSAAAEVVRTGRAAHLSGRSDRAEAVGVPIRVDGRLWGVLAAAGRAAPPAGADRLPADADKLMERFARLMATALGHASIGTGRDRLLAEYAAMRRVAGLVARGAAVEEVFDAVATEASALLGDLATELLWFEGDEAVAVAACNSAVPIGLRIPSHPGTPTGRVLHTAVPVRADRFDETPLADLAREVGLVAGVAVPVVVGGRVLAALTASSCGPPLPDYAEIRLAQFAELVAVAIAGTATRTELTASRARAVASADETRRRLQSDLHRGAQQRVAHTVLVLTLARDALAEGSPAADLVQEALMHAERAGRELRDLVRSILPATLARGGLRPGLESLVADLALPVDLQVMSHRLAPTTETTAYFVAAEALGNAVEYAGARRVGLRVDLVDGILVVEVHDDGIVESADPSRDAGLTGLRDRVAAADGRLTITSSPGHGTVVHAELPVDHRSAISSRNPPLSN